MVSTSYRITADRNYDLRGSSRGRDYHSSVSRPFDYEGCRRGASAPKESYDDINGPVIRIL